MYGEYSEMYSRWCEYYDFENIEIQTIGKYVDIDNKDIIDIGCGTGRFLFRLLPFVKSAIGVDKDKSSIAVLNNILCRKHGQFIPKVKIICSCVENIQIPLKSIDLAFFSWSLYAFDKEEMKQAIKKVSDILRVNGKLVILQPVGGEFESVMRLFFREHSDKDEYEACIENMNEIIPPLFDFIAVDKIISHFTVPDLGEFCDMLKMFAVTEGGCSSNELSHISVDTLRGPMSSFKKEEGFCLEDEVSLFIYSKRGDYVQ